MKAAIEGLHWPVVLVHLEAFADRDDDVRGFVDDVATAGGVVPDRREGRAQ